MSFCQLDIALEEPVALALRTAAGNEVSCLDSIPGTAIRGAIFAELAANGLASQADAWLGALGPRWSAGWLNRGGKVVIPAPKCFLSEKRRTSATATLCNALQQVPARDGFTRLSQSWLTLDSHGKPDGFAEPDLETNMHVGLNYARRASRIGPLYSREELTAGQTFTAYVADPAGLFNGSAIDSFVLGRRKSVGGRCTLTWIPALPPWRPDPNPPFGANKLIIQLMTDAILSGKRGGALRGLDDEALVPLVNHPSAKVEAGASSFDWWSGWSSLWDLPREQALVIKAGSAWLISCDDANSLSVFARQVASDGMGLRRHEGFGWVAVNPIWLTQTLNGPFQIPVGGAAFSAPAPSAWPGLNVPRSDLMQLELWAREDVSALRGQRQQCAELQSYALRCNEPADVSRFLNLRADRENDRGFKNVRDHFTRRFGTSGAFDLPRLCFYYSALGTYLQPQR